MQLLLQALTYHRGSDEPLSLLVILLVRASLVVLTAWLVSVAVRRSSAAVQHRVWLLALMGTLVVPALWALTPGWRMPLLTVHIPGDSSWGHVAPVAVHQTWPELLLLVWIGGTAIFLARWVLGIVAARRMFRGSRGTDNATWLELLSECKRDLAIRRPVELRFVERSVSPAVWSFRRIRILLPEAARSWNRQQRRSVLLHELGHASRWDCLAQLAGGVACAAWWFHPLVWLAARRMRSYAELAADDCVLRAGTERTSYAEHLLSIAASLGRGPQPAFAPRMFHASYLERRVRAILDPSLVRSPLEGQAALAGLLAACSLAIPLATATPSAIRVVPQSASVPRKPQRIDIRLRLPGPAPRQQPVLVPNQVAELASLESLVAEHARVLVIREQDGTLVDPAILPDAGILVAVPQPATQLLPPWEVGRTAEMLIPNWPRGQHAEMLIPGYGDSLPEAVQIAEALRAARSSISNPLPVQPVAPAVE